MVRGGGLEPPRALRTLEPESSESTNSTTRAFCLLSEEKMCLSSKARYIVKQIFTHLTMPEQAQPCPSLPNDYSKDNGLCQGICAENHMGLEKVKPKISADFPSAQ